MTKEQIEEFDAGAKSQQETAEEVAKKRYPSFAQHPFLDGVKWKEERSYSEEEVIKLIDDIVRIYDVTFRGEDSFISKGNIPQQLKSQLVSQNINSITLFEQFKKK